MECHFEATVRNDALDDKFGFLSCEVGYQAKCETCDEAPSFTAANQDLETIKRDDHNS